jgi:TetR/AcrR family transcriptional repressor of mexJK operon
MEKRAAILEAAMGLFPARGYDGASMEAIAQAAGVSKLTVYSHFADKEALFGAAVTECCAQMLPHRLFAPEPRLPVQAALTGIGRAFVDLMMDERANSLHRVMVSQAGHNRRLTEIFFGHGPRAALQEMELFLRTANAEGSLRVDSPAQAAEHFFCLLKGEPHARMVFGCCGSAGRGEIDAHLAATVDMFLRAYAPR